MNVHARRFFILLLIQCSTNGCASAQPIHVRIAPIIESEYVRYTKEGAAKICGRAYYTTRQGEEKYGAGHEVILKPVTTYSTEWFQEGVLAGKKLTPANKQVHQYDRFTTTDDEGEFCFKQLPAGEYYLATYIIWPLPIAWVEIFRKGEGWARARVKIAEREIVRVDVTHRE